MVGVRQIIALHVILIYLIKHKKGLFTSDKTRTKKYVFYYKISLKRFFKNVPKALTLLTNQEIKKLISYLKNQINLIVFLYFSSHFIF